LSFGGFPIISLEEARQQHKDARKAVTLNIDPSKQRKGAAKRCTTLEQIAREWYKHNLQSWVPSTAATLISELDRGLFSLLGRTPIDEITRGTLLKALQTIEERKSSAMAKRSLQYAIRIFRFAAIREHIPYNIALDLQGALKPHNKKHYPSMAIDHLPDFLKKFDQCQADFDQAEKDCLTLFMLTLVRRSELIKAKWPEFSFDKAIWTIPAARMKMKREHLVPLSRQALEILLRRKNANDLLDRTQQSEYVFPGTCSPLKSMDKRTMMFVLHDMGYRNIHTLHGFRALGMGIAKEKLGYRHEVPDRQLAHVPGNDVDRAYDRALFIAERTEMMQRLADYIDGIK
ncbi:MAG: integrase, partial [Sphingobacteriales bacterium]